MNLFLIFYNSSQSAEESQGASNTIVSTIAPNVIKDYDSLTEKQQEMQSKQVSNNVRNYAHTIEFVPVGLLSLLILSTYCRKFPVIALWAVVSAVFCFVCSLFDEVYQELFSEGRGFEWSDIKRDMDGGFIGIAAALIIISVVSVVLHIKTRES